MIFDMSSRDETYQNLTRAGSCNQRKLKCDAYLTQSWAPEGTWSDGKWISPLPEGINVLTPEQLRCLIKVANARTQTRTYAPVHHNRGGSKELILLQTYSRCMVTHVIQSTML